jgi:hypothetical protein
MITRDVNKGIEDHHYNVRPDLQGSRWLFPLGEGPIGSVSAVPRIGPLHHVLT